MKIFSRACLSPAEDRFVRNDVTTDPADRRRFQRARVRAKNEPYRTKACETQPHTQGRDLFADWRMYSPFERDRRLFRFIRETYLSHSPVIRVMVIRVGATAFDCSAFISVHHPFLPEIILLGILSILLVNPSRQTRFYRRHAHNFAYATWNPSEGERHSVRLI